MKKLMIMIASIWLSIEFALPIYGYGPDRTVNQENSDPLKQRMAI